MLTPCPHCDQQVVPEANGACPMCGGKIGLPDQLGADGPVEGERGGEKPSANEDQGPVPTEAEAIASFAAERVDEDIVEEPPSETGRAARQASADRVHGDPPPATRADEVFTFAGDTSPRHGLPAPGLMGAVGLMLAIWLMQLAALMTAMTIATAVGLIDPKIVSSGSPEQVQEHLRQFLNERGGFSFLLPFGSGSVLLLALIVMMCMRHGLTRKIGLRPFTSFQFLLVVMAAAPASLLAAQVAGLIGRLLPSWAFPDIPVAAMGWVTMLVSISILPGISEEILFRGVIGRGLTARYGTASGILLTSLLFGITHVHPGQALFAFFLGLLLHYIYVHTRSLLAPILLHMLVNGAYLLAVRYSDAFPIPGYNRPELGPLTPWPLLAVAAALLLVILWAFYLTQTRFLFRNGKAYSGEYSSAESPPAELDTRAHNTDAHGGLVLLLLLLFVAFIVTLFWATRVAM